MNKKLISLVLIGGVSATLLTGCNSDTKVKLFNIKINGKERSLFEFGGNKEVNEAYEFFKESASKYENDTKKYTKDDTGIGFTQEFTEEEKEAYSHDYNKENILSYIRTAGEQSETNKKTMESYDINNVDFYFKLFCGDDVIIEVRNGVLKQLNLGNEDLENEIINELNGITSEDKTTTKEEESKTCQYCGKKYKPSESDAVEPDKYCSSDCYTEVRMMERNKDAKTTTKYYCSDCGTEISKEQYDSWKRCSSCARTYNNEQRKEYTCEYCGRGYYIEDSDAYDPYNFCSQICEINEEGRIHEEWEKNNEFDENGRLIE